MCYSFNEAANRAAFLEDEEAYCARFGLNDEQRDAVRRRDVLALLEVRRQRLLPRKVHGNLRARRSGYRRATDGHERRSVSREAPSSGGLKRWQDSLAPFARRTFRRSATPSRAGRSSDAYWRAVLCRLSTSARVANRSESRCRDRRLQRSRPELLSRQDCRRSQSAPRPSIATRTRAGACRRRRPIAAIRKCRGTSSNR